MGAAGPAAMSEDCWGPGGPDLLVVAPPAIRPEVEHSPVAAAMGRGCAEKSRQLAEHYRRLAARLGARFLDGEGCELNRVDHMHLTQAGHAQLAARGGSGPLRSGHGGARAVKKAGGDTGNGVPARLPSNERCGEGHSSSPSGSFSGRYRRITRSAGMEASSALRAGVKTASGKKPARGPHRDEQEQDQEQGLGQVAQGHLKGSDQQVSQPHLECGTAEGRPSRTRRRGRCRPRQ